MKDGIYKSKSGIDGHTVSICFVHNEKVLMKILGSIYKTTKHFNFGEWQEDLKPGMIEQFDEVYNEAKQW